MKFIPIAVLLLILASCNHNHDHSEDSQVENQETINTSATSDDDFLDELDQEMDNLWDTNWDEASMSGWNEVLSLNVTYNSPGGNHSMTVALKLEDWVIQSIEATSSEWVRTGFNESLQTLVWGTIEDAENFYAAGSSLASDAFTDAVKSL